MRCFIVLVFLLLTFIKGPSRGEGRILRGGCGRGGGFFLVGSVRGGTGFGWVAFFEEFSGELFEER